MLCCLASAEDSLAWALASLSTWTSALVRCGTCEDLSTYWGEWFCFYLQTSSSHSSSHNNDGQPPSPIPSNPTTSHPPSSTEDAINYFADINVDDEYSKIDQDIPPDINIGDESNEDLPTRDKPMEQHAPNPQIRYIYHPKLNGK